MFRTSKFLLMVTMLMVVVVTTSTLFPFIVGKYAFFRGAVDVALILFLLGLLLDEKEGPVVWRRLGALYRNPLVIAVSAFVGAFLLACFFGFDPHFSFWSNFERGEGGLQMFHMYLFFMLVLSLFREEKDWRELFWWAIGGGVLMGLYGYAASLGVNGFVGAKFTDGSYRFQGSIGNPAYVAIYVLFLAFYILYLMGTGKERWKWLSGKGLLMLALLAFFGSIFLLAATRGAFVGLIAGAIVALSYLGLTNRKWRGKFIVAGSAILLVAILLVVFQKNPVVQKIPGSRIFDISSTAQTFRDRTIMWKIAWDGFLERPVFGWGPENYIVIFARDFNTAYFNPAAGFGAWFDRAHNLALDYLAETGAVGFLAYASMFVAFLVVFLRRRKDGDAHREREAQGNAPASPFIAALFLAIVAAYLVQGMVLFDVSTTYINLFLVLAFSVYKFGDLDKISNLKSQK